MKEMECKDENQGYARFAGHLQLSEKLFFQQKEHGCFEGYCTVSQSCRTFLTWDEINPWCFKWFLCFPSGSRLTLAEAMLFDFVQQVCVLLTAKEN